MESNHRSCYYKQEWYENGRETVKEIGMELSHGRPEKLRTKDVMEKILPATGHDYKAVYLVGEE